MPLQQELKKRSRTRTPAIDNQDEEDLCSAASEEERSESSEGIASCKKPYKSRGQGVFDAGENLLSMLQASFKETEDTDEKKWRQEMEKERFTMERERHQMKQQQIKQQEESSKLEMREHAGCVCMREWVRERLRVFDT